ncbi:SAGA complex subunit spt20 [Neolecta irregularis DAH-3]|uniref:SAGA complex subunit spt20 n=1 Tax=Neolecta irregularis (strain DAH-3) TaxID=1198029 RepID=A0A1U7LLN9_NEOID|nr:SAGA complex subunit spt20 [Neolecta irregularis DAH-3]|eukprot:OLL23574.1 SAGA complex subunit spt20 [Neolecta irregularis DAH-3]
MGEIPADLVEVFRDGHVRYYDGCLIVEIVDHRATAQAESRTLTNGNCNTDKTYRTLLRPTAESIWIDLCLLSETSGGRLNDNMAIQMEAEILAATVPLILDPAPSSGVANAIHRKLRTSLPPYRRKSRQEPSKAVLPVDDIPLSVEEKAKPEFQATFHRLGFIHNWRRQKAQNPPPSSHIPVPVANQASPSSQNQSARSVTRSPMPSHLNHNVPAQSSPTSASPHPLHRSPHPAASQLSNHIATPPPHHPSPLMQSHLPMNNQSMHLHLPQNRIQTSHIQSHSTMPNSSQHANDVGRSQAILLAQINALDPHQRQIFLQRQQQLAMEKNRALRHPPGPQHMMARQISRGMPGAQNGI